MSVSESYEKAELANLKTNLLNLVRDHRAKCDPYCNVSLHLVRLLAEKAGITFTQEERSLFI